MKKAILCISVAAMFSFSASAKIWRVNNGGIPADYTSLQDALTAIPIGDTIYLEGSPNSYALPASITKKVTIIGPGYFLTQNPNTLENKTAAIVKGDVYLLANGIVWEGLAHSEGSLGIGADNIIIRKCYLESVSGDDGNSNTYKKINNATIAQCYINGALDSYFTDTLFNAIITNNIFTATGLGYIVSRLYNTTIENNTFYSTSTVYGINNCNGCAIKNNIVTALNNNVNCNITNNYTTAGVTDFIGSATGTSDGKYQLSSTSAAKTAGTNGSECGAFGGTTPYVLSGLPAIPHIYEIEAPNAASAASGLKVTLKIGTER